MKRKEHFSNHSMSTTLYPDKDTGRKESYRAISLLSTDKKKSSFLSKSSFTKILVNKINNKSKGKYIMTNWNLSLDAKLIKHMKINIIHHINRLKKNYTSDSTEAEKAFNKIQKPLTIQTLSKLEI